MSLGFDDKSKIPGITSSVDKKVPKIKRSNPKKIRMNATKANDENVEDGLVINRTNSDKKIVAERRTGRPRKINMRDTMTLTGEKYIIDRFREFCDKHHPKLSLVECLEVLLDGYNNPNPPS